MDETKLKELVKKRIRILAGPCENEEHIEYCIEKALAEAADYCNLSGPEYFPRDAETCLAEYAAASYLLEAAPYRPQWEDMRADAKISLRRFRRIRW